LRRSSHERSAGDAPPEDTGWLHDDQEEDLVGAYWHQTAIRELSVSLRDIARTRCLPWHVGDQLALVVTRPHGALWRPSPDIMIHPEASPEERAEIVASVDGVPALIVEVTSPSTWEYDIDATGGEAGGYL